jgi:hypothetical protein
MYIWVYMYTGYTCIPSISSRMITAATLLSLQQYRCHVQCCPERYRGTVGTEGTVDTHVQHSAVQHGRYTGIIAMLFFFLLFPLVQGLEICDTHACRHGEIHRLCQLPSLLRDLPDWEGEGWDPRNASSSAMALCDNRYSEGLGSQERKQLCDGAL